MKSIVFLLVFLVTLSSFGQAGKMDIVIRNANIFDSKTGEILLDQTILIKDGIIVNVSSKQKKYSARKTIDAGGRLVTPGFIDTHIHPTDVYRSYGALPSLLRSVTANEFSTK